MAERKPTRAEAVRSAVDDAFQAAAGQVGRAGTQSRDRAQELADELAGAAGRLRDVLDDLRPPTADDVRELRAELRALAERVHRLEEAGGASSRSPAGES